jgi:hypothetical protein
MRQTFEVECSPQENQRLEVYRVFLEAGIEGIRTHGQKSCADLVFNPDEIGVSEWGNWVERKVIVPSTMTEQKIFRGIHRRLKHISVVTI